MPVSLVVAGIAVLTALLIIATSWRRPRAAPLDVTHEHRWLVRWLLHHPRVGRLARRLDDGVAGGLLVVVGWIVVFAVAIAIGLLFDMVSEGRGLAVWDRAVADWGSAHATDTSVTALKVLTQFGATPVLALVAVAVGLYDRGRRRSWTGPLYLFTVLVGIVILNNALKSVIDRPRPDVAHLVRAHGSSFPSGHSSAATAGWLAIAFVVARPWRLRRRVAAGALAGALAMSVAASRALLGVHWLTDVVAGVVEGYGWFLLCTSAFGPRLERLGQPTRSVDLIVSRGSRRSATTTSRPPH